MLPTQELAVTVGDNTQQSQGRAEQRGHNTDFSKGLKASWKWWH